MERLVGTNAIIIVDSKGHYLFRPTAEMRSPLTNHHFFFRALTEEGLVLYGRHAWEQLGKQIPPADTAKIMVGMDIEEAAKAFPYRKILIVGNRTAIRSLHAVQNVILIKYKQLIPADHLDSPLTLDVLDGKPVKLLCETPYFTISDLSLKLDHYETAKINTAFSPAYVGGDPSLHV